VWSERRRKRKRRTEEWLLREGVDCETYSVLQIERASREKRQSTT
jgi:hypothetical protein